MVEGRRCGSKWHDSDVSMTLGWAYWLASAHVPREKPTSYPTLRCAACGGVMRVVAVTHLGIEVILANHALAFLDSG